MNEPPAGRSGPPELAGYVVREEIGFGGSATVYAAQETAFDRTVAIKVLSTRVDRETGERFEQERRALGAVSGHPHIVDVYASGVDDRGRPYLIMEYVAGGSLADRISEHGALPWPEAVAIGIKLAGALESAHRVGVLHRDVKPENVLISAYGEPQLADFGISRIESLPSTTHANAVAATPLHAAPELFQQQPASAESEVYSLASTLFALIAGHAPFQDDTDEHAIALLYRVATDPVPDLRPGGVPDDVCRAIERGLAKLPADRPHSALQFGFVLRSAQQAHGIAATPMQLVAQTGATFVATEHDPAPPPESRTPPPATRPITQPGAERPGARLAARPLHLIWIADCSESMILDGKMQALNEAIRTTIPALREVAADNPHARVLVRCLAFSTGTKWTIASPTPVDELEWVDLRAEGYTDTGAALAAVASELRVPPLEARALPPVLVLISDGHATDDYDHGLAALFEQPWGRKAIRIAIAIGEDADIDALNRFVANPELRPLQASNAQQLTALLRWASTVATRAASAPAADVTANVRLPPVPTLIEPRQPTAW